MFDRKKSDDLFNELLDYLDELHIHINYKEYITLHNFITTLYDSFSEVEDSE